MLILAIIFVTAGAGAVPVEEWNRTYMDASFNDVQELSDGGYIFAGYGYILGGHKSFTGDYGQKNAAIVIKIDSSGNEQWNQTFDENIDEYDPFGGEINSIRQSNDGGFIIAQTTRVDYLFYSQTFKLDPGGNIEWNRTVDISLPVLQVELIMLTYFLTILETPGFSR